MPSTAIAADPLDEKDEERNYADDKQHRRDAPEEVQRVESPAGDEHDGNEVEKAVEKAPGAVFALPVLAARVLHLDFLDLESLPAGKHGNKAVQLSVDRDRIDDFSPVRFETAIEIVELDAAHERRDGVEQPRRRRLGNRVMPRPFPSRDQVGTGVQRGDQIGDLPRIVLEGGVHSDDDVAVDGAKRRLESG